MSPAIRFMGRSYDLPDKIENARRRFQENVISVKKERHLKRGLVCVRVGLGCQSFLMLIIFLINFFYIYIKETPDANSNANAYTEIMLYWTLSFLRSFLMSNALHEMYILRCFFLELWQSQYVYAWVQAWKRGKLRRKFGPALQWLKKDELLIFSEIRNPLKPNHAISHGPQPES